MYYKMISVYISLSLAHVPSYGCVQNCCQLRHDYKVSQAFYLKDSGGVEIHLNTLDFTKQDHLDVDAVFRDEVDVSTFDLYIGCGGCAPNDPIVEQPYSLGNYLKPEIEPFTQTVYRSIIPKHDRKINFTTLKACKDPHFTIRLHKYENASTIFWSPIIGLGEQFTFLELLSFPIYIRRNHGSYWNEADYYYIWLLIVSPVLFYLLGVSNILKCNKMCNLVILNRIKNYKNVFLIDTYKSSSGLVYIDALFYDVSRIGFLSSLIDKFFSIVYVQSKIDYTHSFWPSFLLVVVLPETLAISLVTVLYRNKKCDYAGIFSIMTGLVSFLFLGVGYFIGPAFVTLAGVYRLYFVFYNR